MDYSVTVQPSLNVTTSTDDITLRLNPATNPFASENLTVTVGTNNQTGYQLIVSTPNDTTNLVEENDSNLYIETLSSEVDADHFTANRWGYKLDSTSTNYAPFTSGTLVNSSDGPVNNVSNTLSFAAKASYGTRAGTYNLALNFQATANPLVTTLYDTIASMSKGTQTAAQLQETITVPTSADRTQDTSNSGVYEYNASVFGTATDASNDYPIYYYRGVLENSVGSYGSDGSAVTYPNYVRLGGNSTSSTCWRIVRTTGSGGVKMIYNGNWTGSTCGNSTTASQFPSTTAFNAATNIVLSIVGVGYTYNANYKSTTSTTQAGTLFGTNSNYSGNTTNSTIKDNIESWYTSNLASSYGSYLETNAGYCGDRSINSGDSWITWNDTIGVVRPYSGTTVYYFGAHMRNTTTYQNITLGCPRSTVDLYTTNTTSAGNKQLSNPIALLTADEASFAGSGSSDASNGSSYHSNSYLRSGSSFWLLSAGYRASNQRTCVFALAENGTIGDSGIDYTKGVRPVISLAPGATISSGSGTATDPWEVVW